MRFRRALFRLWVVFAILFASYTMALAILSFNETSDELAAWDQPGNPYHRVGEIVNPPSPWRNLLTLTGLAFGAPIVALILGRVLFWAADGFRDNRGDRRIGASETADARPQAEAVAEQRQPHVAGRG